MANPDLIRESVFAVVLTALAVGSAVALIALLVFGLGADMTKHEEVIEVGHSLIRRCHDLSDVLSAISVAARLVVEHLETTETALVEMIAFIEGRGHD